MKRAKRGKRSANADLRAASPDTPADSPDLPAAVADKGSEERCAANASVYADNAVVRTANTESLTEIGVRLMSEVNVGGIDGMGGIGAFERGGYIEQVWVQGIGLYSEQHDASFDDGSTSSMVKTLDSFTGLTPIQ